MTSHPTSVRQQRACGAHPATQLAARRPLRSARPAAQPLAARPPPAAAPAAAASRRRQAVVLAAVPAAATPDHATTPHLQLATARLPEGVNRDAFLRSLYQWAGAHSRAGPRLPGGLETSLTRGPLHGALASTPGCRCCPAHLPPRACCPSQ